MNANAWPETLKAVRGVFFPGDVDGENNIDHHKSILQTLNSNCVKDEDKQTEFKDELEKDDFEIDDPDDKRRILLARDRQKNIGDVTGLSVAKIINVVTFGTCAKLFKKKGHIGNTKKSTAEDFFPLFWYVKLLEGKIGKSRDMTTTTTTTTKTVRVRSSGKYIPVGKSLWRYLRIGNSASGKCGKCNEYRPNTTWHWDEEKNEGYICRACYRYHKSLREERVCPECRELRRYWDTANKGKFKGQKICHSCNVDINKKIGTCPICQDPPKRCIWYNIQRGDYRWAKIEIQIDAEKESIPICNNCYNMTREGRYIDCGELKTTRWYIHPITQNKEWCRRCHDKAKKAEGS